MTGWQQSGYRNFGNAVADVCGVDKTGRDVEIRATLLSPLALIMAMTNRKTHLGSLGRISAMIFRN